MTPPPAAGDNEVGNDDDAAVDSDPVVEAAGVDAREVDGASDDNDVSVDSDDDFVGAVVI